MVKAVSELMAEAQEKLKEQEEFIEKLMSPPSPIAVVLSVGAGGVVVASGGEQILVQVPPLKVAPGMLVRLQMETKQILSIVSIDHHSLKEVGDVVGVVADNGPFLEVEGGGLGTKQVLRGALGEVEVGDRVVLDQSRSITLAVAKAKERFTLGDIVDTKWSDIGAQDEAVDAVKRMIEEPILHKEAYAAYGMKPLKGVLLSGPPGCGKTLIGKAAATALAKLNKKEKGGFQYVKGPEVLNMYVGQSEQNVREIFANSRRFTKRHGHPALLFVDEAEALLRRRGSGISSDIGDTVVPAFLAELDGLEESGTLVILATNRPELLDDAVIREGRIDRKVSVKRPDRGGALDILKIYLKKLALYDGERLEDAKEAIGYFFGYTTPILVAILNDGGKEPLLLKDVVSGAMLSAVVTKASYAALGRDVKEDRRKFKGPSLEDLKVAIDEVYREQKVVGHHEVVREKWGNVKGIERAS